MFGNIAFDMNDITFRYANDVMSLYKYMYVEAEAENEKMSSTVLNVLMLQSVAVQCLSVDELQR